MAIRLSSVASILSLLLATSATNAVSASIMYSTAGNPVSQDFNGLQATAIGSPFHTWTDNTTLSGWYSSRTAYNGGTGSSNVGNLYSFGVNSSATDRALGSLASGGTGSILYAVAFENTTGQALTSFSVAYTGEQWREGTANHVGATQRLSFDYRISAGLGTIATTGTEVDVTSLDFVSKDDSTNGPLNGNLAANRTSLSQTISNISWGAGQFLWLRWEDIDDQAVGLISGNDHGLGIDDFSFSATATVPEPASLAFTGALIAGTVVAARRRKAARLKRSVVC